MIELYERFNLNKKHTLIGLFRLIKNNFKHSKILYPGCYVHITPSLIFSNVTYVDSFRDTNKFYESEDVKYYINENKEYCSKTHFKFLHKDYSSKLNLELESFDIIISLFGGFVGKYTKQYLKKGGILLCNDSHGDASMAFLDPDYEFIGIYNEKTDEEYELSFENLEDYFKLKKNKTFNREELEKSMKGLLCTKSPSGYIFKKLKTQKTRL